jgi:hypothetical protein
MRTGAVVPSSNALARRITSDILPNGGPVIELGPGTGAFTRGTLGKWLPEDKLRLGMRAALPADLKKGFSEAVIELEKVSFNFDGDVAVEKAARDKIISQGSTFYPSLLVADQKAVDSLLDAYEFAEPGPQPCRNRLADPQVTTDLPPCAPICSSYCQERAGRPPLFKS